MQLSVIIPCYNVKDVLPDQLQALASQKCGNDWEIIIADNGSNENLDKIIKIYSDRLPQISVVDAKSKKGPAHARNVGARHARGKYLGFIDADDIADENWIKQIGDAVECYDFVASRLDLSKLNSPDMIRTRGIAQDHTLLQFSIVKFLPYAVTSGLGIRKEIHDMIGGFDEELRCAEDAEYCWRVQLAGYTLHFAEEAVLHYRYRDSLWKSFKQAKEYGEYDVLLYKKYQKFNIPKQNKKKALKDWKKLLREIPKIYKYEKRNMWVRSFGKKLGRLKGSIKYRIFVP